MRSGALDCDLEPDFKPKTPSGRGLLHNRGKALLHLPQMLPTGRKPARGKPYEDVENLRPETKQMVATWATTYGDAKDVVLGVEAAGN